MTTPSYLVVKEGYLSIKEDSFKSWRWQRRWALLREHTLTFHRNESSYQASSLVFLKEVLQVSRNQLRTHSFEIITKDKTYYISCKDDEELYSWMDAIYQRSSQAAVSNPTNFVHEIHVDFDPVSGVFTGLPPGWAQILQKSNITKEDYKQNPQAVIDALGFYTGQSTKNIDVDYGDKWAGLIPQNKAQLGGSEKDKTKLPVDRLSFLPELPQKLSVLFDEGINFDDTNENKVENDGSKKSALAALTANSSKPATKPKPQADQVMSDMQVYQALSLYSLNSVYIYINIYLKK
ncbi:PBD-domain-containing protein [Neoconidiobolus thromboides FSU 785]|nr:PBD-domain-containing protein [Neoconidiobolus thromboides FSU 785]